MNNPKISVIIPIYKAEAYLKKCLNSIIDQDFDDMEVLLIDDGSPDKSGEICDEYVNKDKRFIVFHKDNGGVSSARQLGTDKAKGDYIIHIDPDDWIEKNMLQTLYSTAKSDQADIVICDYFVDYGRYVKTKNNNFSNLDHVDVLKSIINNSTGFMWNKLIKRSCYSTPIPIKWPIGLNHFEDLITCVKLLSAPRNVSYVNKPFYHYTQCVNSNSYMHHTHKFYNLRERLLNEISPYLDKEIYKMELALLEKQLAYTAFVEKVASDKELIMKYAYLGDYHIDWYGEPYLTLALNGHTSLSRTLLKIRAFITVVGKRMLYF